MFGLILSCVLFMLSVTYLQTKYFVYFLTQMLQQCQSIHLDFIVNYTLCMCLLNAQYFTNINLSPKQVHLHQVIEEFKTLKVCTSNKEHGFIIGG